MECVPAKVAVPCRLPAMLRVPFEAEITKRTTMLVFSMGSGPDCDGQFIFTEARRSQNAGSWRQDLMGTTLGSCPRHSITYANLMTEAVNAVRQFCKDVHSGAYPQAPWPQGRKTFAGEALHQDQR